MTLTVPASHGDALDRVAILTIKVARVRDETKRARAFAELAALRGAWRAAGLPEPATVPEWPELVRVNGDLWAAEDALRDAEAREDFGPAFVVLARSIYQTNDRRAAVKAAVSARFGSALVEVKEHPPYPEVPRV